MSGNEPRNYFSASGLIRTWWLQNTRPPPRRDTMKLMHIAMAAALVAAPALMNAQSNREINQRKVDQQHRIGQGVRSGELTPGETARLERQERGINREERGMRRADGGHLTQRDRRILNHQQNRESQRIYRDKHNNHVY
jgi:hypothetical protein